MGKTISEAIVQQKFRNEYHKAVIALVYTANQLTASHQKFFKAFGISHQQFNVLRILRGQFPRACRLNLIRSRMIDKMSDVSRIVERLRIAGMLYRGKNKANRRAVDIKISKAALELLEKIDGRIWELEQPMRELGSNKAKQLVNLLEMLIK